MPGSAPGLSEGFREKRAGFGVKVGVGARGVKAPGAGVELGFELSEQARTTDLDGRILKVQVPF